MEETTPRHPWHWLERKRGSLSTVQKPRRRRTESHARDSRRRHAVGHETRLQEPSTATPKPRHAEDGGVWHVSIMRSRVVQHPDFSISVRCKDTTEKIELVRYDPKGRKQPDLARDHEIAQLRSVVGVARQCRPQLSYGVNKLQSVCGTATLDDSWFANKLLQEAKDSLDDGLFFKSGLFTWDKMEMLTITDASFGNESNFRSQKGRMTFVTGPDSFVKNGMGVHLIGSSTIIRVCRSTLQAETYALSDAKSPCDSVPRLMHMACPCAQNGSGTLPVSCVTCGWSIATHSATIFVTPSLRGAATRDSVSIWLRCATWSGLLLMESCEKESDQISPTW